MHLHTIYLYNFRRFKGPHQISLQRGLTVFAANNGAGKSSVLDAIALAFGAFLNRLPKVAGNALSDRDICLQRESSSPFAFVAAATIEETTEDHELTPFTRPAKWHRLKVFQGNKANRELVKHAADLIGPEGLKEINALADYVAENVSSVIDFPVLAYYGTGRAILDIPQRRRGFGKDFPRLQAYADCLNPRTNFKKLFEYFYYLEDLERREKVEKAELKYENGQLGAIRAAICTFLPEYTNPRTALRPLRFLLDHTTDGTTYSIEQLSDGYKTSLAMVMDIASRAVEANPHLGVGALKVSGIVLIDEIELHLHPSWQQRIIPDLQRTFPNIQFICTTHSPQVLSTVKQESIRIITDDGTVMSGEEAGVNTYGAQSYIILEDLMNVSPNPRIPEVEELKDKLKRRLAAATIGIDDPEIQKLENMVGSKDPFLRNLKASILKSAKTHA
jgi:predicted ATP-binding protein involved in virulence